MEASKKSESAVRAKLESELKGDEIILEKPRIYIKGEKGKWANPDFVIYNRRTDKISRVVDAKNGNAEMSNNQKLLNEKGGILYQSGRYGIKYNKNRAVKKNSFEVETTNF